MHFRTSLLLTGLTACLVANSSIAADGRSDYDLDDNGLIEINDLADLNEIRNHLDGSGLYGSGAGCPDSGCTGFELTTDLDFDTNGDGVMDASDDYWNDGAGWEPIGSSSGSFQADFHGNGHLIRNLYIDRPNDDYIGLFGSIQNASIQSVGLTGTLTYIHGDDFTGTLAGRTNSNTTMTAVFALGDVEADNYAGGLVGYLHNTTVTNSFTSSRVDSTGISVGGFAGLVTNGSITASYSTGSVSGAGNVGGFAGDAGSNDITAVHWATDSSGQSESDDSSADNNYQGATLAQLQCPVAGDDEACSGIKLYAGWGDMLDGDDDPYWNFGTSEELPGLTLNGVVYRDSDNDRVLDHEDAFPYESAASEDADNDGYPDRWTLGCDSECRAASGLVLDNLPDHRAAWQDEDLDGLPESWAEDCDSDCQTASGLTLDTFPDDYDNDGLDTATDTDDNGDGIADVDADSDGLIDITSLSQLNAMRFSLDGAQQILTDGADGDASGCPATVINGALQALCSGYELTTDLDFDENTNGDLSDDSFWNAGTGWVPIGDSTSPFTATFNGRGHQIRNLYTAQDSYTGLFGFTSDAELKHLALTGPLTRSAGLYYIGILVGYASDTQITGIYTAGETAADYYYAGGIAGALMVHSSLSNSYSTTRVIASSGSGGITGRIDNASIHTSLSTGYNSGAVRSGGLAGNNDDSTFSRSYWATDTTQQDDSTETPTDEEVFGTLLVTLQCPTTADDVNCSSTTLFSGWSEEIHTTTAGATLPYWDFGTTDQLPGLMLNGVLYRDSDGDGYLDENDAFVNAYAAALDSDGDGYPDQWNSSCDTECIEASGLQLDVFPEDDEVWQDSDLDGLPDTWADDCDSDCQALSGYTLDSFPDDHDNDGLSTAEDTDDNGDGIIDADADSDGLIDIETLDELNAIRFRLNGVSQVLSDGGSEDSSGCPATIIDGVMTLRCSGYELLNDLDFDTNQDGDLSDESYYNAGAGWLPLGNDTESFTAEFNGNHFAIHNLFVNETEEEAGLFGKTELAYIHNVTLTGDLTSVFGDNETGLLIGEDFGSRIHRVFVSGKVSGEFSCGGLLGYAIGSEISESGASVTINCDGTAGGLAAELDYSSVSASFATGSVTGDYMVGGLVGVLYRANISASYSSAVTYGGYATAGLIGYSSDSVISGNFATGYVDYQDSDYGGLIGQADDTEISDSYWATDSTGQTESDDSNSVDGYVGALLEELQCPESANNSSCSIEHTLFSNWADFIDEDNDAYWDFGDTDQLPGLRINQSIYRDSDGDGSLDGSDAFPLNAAASLDSDDDGYPDQWNPYCDSDCVSLSGLSFDALPDHPAAWQDDDFDGLPDSWHPECDVACQETSGLTLDLFLNDMDNDGLTDAEDPDDNGDSIADADGDSDGLIDIATLEELYAIRHDLSGVGQVLDENGVSDSSGCPFILSAGTYVQSCSGYELVTDLDFDTDGDGDLSDEAFWNDGEGWQPLGSRSNDALTAVFDGKYYEIRNLYINRPDTDYIGLFGFVYGGEIRSVGITGDLASVTGDDYAGMLVGASYYSTFSELWSTGNVIAGDDYAGGLIGLLEFSTLNAAYATGDVSGDANVGGLIGRIYDTLVSNTFATGTVSGRYQVGGLIGRSTSTQDSYYIVSNSYATGDTSGGDATAGLIGYNYATTQYSYWATDSTGSTDGNSTSEYDVGFFGVSEEELRCPTSADDIQCIEGTLYAGWGSALDATGDSYWEFGTSSALPGLKLGNVFHGDSDGDGTYDQYDDYPYDYDNDGYTDADETAAGSDPYDADDLPADDDGDGISNATDPYPNDVDNDGVDDSEDSDNTNDNGAPEILSVGAELSVSADLNDATQVALDYLSLLAEVSAFDAVDASGALTYQCYLNGEAVEITETGQLLLPTGRQILEWTATDLSGNQSDAVEQAVNVYPEVRFATTDILTAEGATTEVVIELSGESPVYPVVVELAVDSDNSTLTDADLDGISLDEAVTVTIEAGTELPLNTRGYLPLSILHDDIEEGDEVLIVEIMSVDMEDDDTEAWFVLAEGASRLNLTVTGVNIAPQIALSMSQNGEVTDTLTVASGSVTLSVDITDANVDDEHTLSWELNGLYSASSDATQFSFPSSDLVAGSYLVTVTVTDNGRPSLSTSASLQVTVVADESSDGAGGAGSHHLLWLILMLGLIPTRRRR
ncbi:hypothetical protein [uncultured Thalassolituus sp.]|uniref:hypothetical protein n=1 Tax=uncultured Thalassolituus sp. TaxID=285273 RepID=UPI00261FF37F|nr:hypothetical protein [uncultured Thalassolituus sp.]